MNYQRELEKILEGLEQDAKVPRLLLHSCCAPCSSYCIEYLSRYFEITVFYYNPNISQREEYEKRAGEQIRLIGAMQTLHPVDYRVAGFAPETYFEAVRGLEQCPEGGERCFACYEMRLRAAAKAAQQGGYDYFTTTLTISPLKNSEKINEIGLRLGREYKTAYLVSDFKKREGYKRSVELSREYGLYRQNYCGCVFSQREKEERGKETAAKKGKSCNSSQNLV